MKTLKLKIYQNFGTTEVLKINLDIDEGNFLVLLGPSGWKINIIKHNSWARND